MVVYFCDIIWGMYEQFLICCFIAMMKTIPDSKVPGATMGPIWGQQDPGGPHVGPMNFAIWALRWRHNGCNSVSNHQPHDCLLNRLFRRRSKKTSKLRVTGLCMGNSSGTGEFPARMASNVENVSIWWCHHGWFVIMPKLSSLVAPEVLIMTILNASSADKVGMLTTLGFQWI